MLRTSSLLALLLVAPLAAVPLAVAQTANTTATTTAAVPSGTWVAIASEGDFVVQLPAGATYRLGDSTHNLWSAPVTVTAATTFSPLSFPGGQFPFADPDPDTVKELDVLEIPTAQTVAILNQDTGVSSTKIVPPLVATANLVPVAPGSSHTLTFSNFSTSPTAGTNALMLALVNAPASMANHTWEGTQMNLTIDGVTLTCTYGQTYTNEVFTLSCSVPTAATSTTTTGQ